MRDTETARTEKDSDDVKLEGGAAASNHAFEQTSLLQGLAREWRENIAGIRRTLLARGEKPPAVGWTDIRHSVSPLDSVVVEASERSRVSRAIENGKWLMLTVIPVLVASLFALRSKKFRD